jgi:gamma-glutamylcyclotransferase (GGCT)/AIG2-like uncharacterized protein YtfP
MIHPAITHLFVYGSLRSGFQSPAYDYITRYFQLVAAAQVRGKLFDMGEYPAAVPAPDEDSWIKGELYLAKSLEEFSFALAQLDDYEGVKVEKHETPLYRREVVQVDVQGHWIPSWIYWYNGDVSGRPEVKSGDILQYLKDKS